MSLFLTSLFACENFVEYFTFFNIAFIEPIFFMDSYKEESKEKNQRIHEFTSLLKSSDDEEEEETKSKVLSEEEKQEIEEKESALRNQFYSGENPFALITELFPEDKPCFDICLINEFVSYINEKKEGWFELLTTLIESNKTNARNLISCGIINEILISDCPESFEVIDRLLIVAKNDISVAHFISCGGIAELIFYSDVEEFKGFIAHILYIISKCNTICYDYEYTPISYMKRRGEDSEEEIPRLKYIDMIDNLMKSDNSEVIIIVLHAIKRMFKYSSDAVNSICEYFIRTHVKPTDDLSVNILIIQILENAFKRNYEASLSNECFLIVREAVESIINIEDVDLNLLACAIDLVRYFFDGKPENVPILDLFKETTIIETLVEKSRSVNLSCKKAIIDLFSELLKYMPREKINDFVVLGFIGVFCEYSDTNNERILEQVLYSICLLMNNCFPDKIPGDDAEALSELSKSLEEKETKNSVLKTYMQFITSTVAQWDKDAED